MTCPKFATLKEACQYVEIEEPHKTSGTGFIRTRGLDTNKKNCNGAVKFFPGGNGGYVVNNHKGEGDPTREAVFYYDLNTPQKPLSARERKALIKANQEAMRAENEARRLKAMAIAEVARKLSGLAYHRKDWIHPYLIRKGIQAAPGANFRLLDSEQVQDLIDKLPPALFEGEEKQRCPRYSPLLFVPLYDEKSNTPKNAQLITTTGLKTFLKGAPIKGLLWLPEDCLESNLSEVGLCEGIATAISARRLFGYPCAAGLSANCLPAAAAHLRHRYPNARIHVLADRDENKAGENGGMSAIRKLIELNANNPNADITVCPEVSQEEMKAFRKKVGNNETNVTDFNDIELLYN